MLKKTRSEVYLIISDKPAVVTHVFPNKLKLADWSTEKAGAEGLSKICVGVFAPSSKEHRARAAEEVHNVEMDGVLNQPETQQSAIRKTLTVSYRINSIYDAIKTLVTIFS